MAHPELPPDHLGHPRRRPYLPAVLRRLIGVTTVYVSPVTALAYLDYLPAQVTEEELVQAIGRQGYRVGDRAHRFDWRHA